MGMHARINWHACMYVNTLHKCDICTWLKHKTTLGGSLNSWASSSHSSSLLTSGIHASYAPGLSAWKTSNTASKCFFRTLVFWLVFDFSAKLPYSITQIFISSISCSAWRLAASAFCVFACARSALSAWAWTSLAWRSCTAPYTSSDVSADLDHTSLLLESLLAVFCPLRSDSPAACVCLYLCVGV